MKIALFQMKIQWEDKEKNLADIEKILKVIDADMILLPEMSLTGFSFNTEVTKEKNKETVSKIRELAEKYHITIGVGWVKDGTELCENHYSIVKPEGEVLDYTKIHPFSYSGEDKYFKGGNDIAVCEFMGFKISVLICYDLRFPEVFQRASKEAELIIIPANWPAKRREHFVTLLKARAIENQCYIAGVNCVGEVGGLYYSGDSVLYNPLGDVCECEVVSTGKCEEEKILIYNVNNDVSDYRNAFPVKMDRREELYKRL